MGVEEYDEYDFDPWETTSGLPDQITVKVTNPHFGYDPQLQDGRACAFFLEGTDEEGEFSQWYTVGRNWEPAAKGRRLVPENDKERRRGGLNNQTNYALLFKSLQKAAEEQGLTDELRRRGTPLGCDLWQDLELFMVREEYTNTIAGEKREGSRLNVGRIVKIPGATKATKAPSPTAVAEEAAVEPANGLSPRVKVALRKLAEKVKADGGSHSQFAEAAFSDVDGVLDNPAAEDAVMDQGAGSIWASV